MHGNTKIKLYRTVNIFCLSYKGQSVNAVGKNNSCFYNIHIRHVLTHIVRQNAEFL